MADMTMQEAISIINEIISYFPHSEAHCALNKAIDAMKEKTPRVLSAEEVNENMPMPVWVEDRIIENNPCIYLDIVKQDTPNIKFILGKRYGMYGFWRFWTHKPTGEQMDAMPWRKRSER